MATVTRVSALTAAIALFPEGAPEVDVLTRLRDSLSKSKSGVSDATARNIALGEGLLPSLPEGVLFTCADVMASGADLSAFNTSSRTGGVSPQHVSRVLQEMAKADMLTVHHVGRVTLYERK